jgi:hypothetical protein
MVRRRRSSLHRAFAAHSVVRTNTQVLHAAGSTHGGKGVSSQGNIVDGDAGGWDGLCIPQRRSRQRVSLARPSHWSTGRATRGYVGSRPPGGGQILAKPLLHIYTDPRNDFPSNGMRSLAFLQP